MTPEKLARYREGLVSQQNKALATYHQTTGAIAFIDQVLKDEAPPLSEEELKKVLGAESISVVEPDPQP